MFFLRVYTAALGCLVLAACSSGLERSLPELSPAASSGTLRIKVTAGNDDAEEVNRTVQLSGQALDFGAKTVVGLRFEGVRVPKGTRIRAAHLEFRALTAGRGNLTLTVRGDDSSSAGAFSNRRGGVSARSKTSTSATWRPLAWSAGQTARTSDLTNVVQEIVGRSDWRSGNALAFTVSGSGGGGRAAISRDKNAAYAPTLVVTFGGSGSPTPPPVSGAANRREWHQRLLATIRTPRYQPLLDPKKLAASGDLFKLGRNLNNNVTGIILAYRETGDRDLARHLDAIMNIAKSKLRDTNGDGYKNWTYKHKGADRTSRPYVGTDKHVMDEMMTHSMVAAAAYTLKQAGFSSSARFWTDYLKNDFEAKWRKRNGKRSGFPFITHKLMHPTAQFVRYNYYMYKLTGQGGYLGEARRMARVIQRHMKPTTTPSGPGYTWLHDVNERTGRGSLGCQLTVYANYTTQAFADLASANSSLFSTLFMKRVANTMAYRVLKNPNGTKLAGRVCGDGSYGSVFIFAQYPYAQLAPWDASGRLKAAAERAYAATERRSMSSPKTANLAAQMVFALNR
jgi:hypothetical protein